jgi:hypothetical protein
VNSESTATEILQISMYSILETKALAFIQPQIIIIWLWV